MKRRQFIGALGTTLAAMCSPESLPAASGKLHIVTLSFDDGFRKSFLGTAEIYEKFGLSACFNIVAAAHLPETVVRDDYMPREQFGDFGVWNELQDRGHEIMIHGYQHAHKASLPFEKGKELILKSLDVFSKELRGFDPKKAVFNFPYNESTPELEEWLPSVVMAFRTRGGILNPILGPNTRKITTGGWGPGNAHDVTYARCAQLGRCWLALPSSQILARCGYFPTGSQHSRACRRRQADLVNVRTCTFAAMRWCYARDSNLYSLTRTQSWHRGDIKIQKGLLSEVICFYYRRVELNRRRRKPDRTQGSDRNRELPALNAVDMPHVRIVYGNLRCCKEDCKIVPQSRKRTEQRSQRQNIRPNRVPLPEFLFRFS
jgi:hypothetical protein